MTGLPAAADVALTLDPNPGATGGHVGGVIEIRQVPLRATELTLELSCTYFHRSGNNQSSSSVVWQDIARFPCRMRADGAIEVPFCFYVPEEAPNTVDAPGDHYTWRLRIRSMLDAEDFARHWNVPVTASGVHASPAIAALSAMASSPAVIDRQLHLTQDASGVTMDDPAGRYAVAAGYMLAFGVVACGIGLIKHDIATKVFFGLIGLPVSAGGLWLLGAARRVDVRRDGLFVHRSLFGVPVAKKEFAFARIAGLGVVKSSLSMQGENPRVYYEVRVKTVDDSTQTVSDGFVGYSAAMQAARRLSEITGLKMLNAPPAAAPIQPRYDPVQQTPVQPSAAVQSPVAQQAAAPRLPAANTFIDRFVDSRRAVSRFRYISQGVAAILFLVVGYLFGARHLPLLLNGAKTTGTIVDSRKENFEGKHGSKTDYTPIVAFAVVGRTVRVQGHWARDTRPIIGETITVFYDVDNPDNAVVDAGLGNWVPGVPIASVGVFLAFVALRGWLASRRD